MATTLARQLDDLRKDEQIDLPLLSSACRLLACRLEERIGGDVVSPAAAVACTVPPAVMRRLGLELSNCDPTRCAPTTLGSCAVCIRDLGGQPGIVMTGAAIEVLRGAVAAICDLIKASTTIPAADVALLSSQLTQRWSEVLSVLSSEPERLEQGEAHRDFDANGRVAQLPVLPEPLESHLDFGANACEIAQLNMAITRAALSAQERAAADKGDSQHSEEAVAVARLVSSL